MALPDASENTSSPTPSQRSDLFHDIVLDSVLRRRRRTPSWQTCLAGCKDPAQNSSIRQFLLAVSLLVCAFDKTTADKIVAVIIKVLGLVTEISNHGKPRGGRTNEVLLYSGQRVISLLGKAPAKDIQESISFHQRFLKKRHASALAFLERAGCRAGRLFSGNPAACVR